LATRFVYSLDADTTGAAATLRSPSPRPCCRAKSFTLDGEAVVCGPEGIAIFDALHRRGTVTEAMLYAFDLLELDGEDLREMPLGDRKKHLARLLGGRGLGIVQALRGLILADAKATMIARDGCSDVLVTCGGTNKEAVLGLVTNVDLAWGR
jgi:hypothetical protein